MGKTAVNKNTLIVPANNAGTLGYYSLTSGEETEFSSYLQHIETELKNHKKHEKRSIERIAASYGITNKNIVKEVTELAIVRIAGTIVRQKDKSNFEKYEEIVNLYKHQVNLSHRTSKSMLLQQYSTPAPIAYLAGLFILNEEESKSQKSGRSGVKTKDYSKIYDKEANYFEPSAGNGLLTIALPIEQTIVNEIDDFRLQNLRTQDFKQITSQDATLPFPDYYKKFDGVITNPPFGTLMEAEIYDTYRIKTLDHLMALRALDTMKDDGRAAIIIGGHTKWDDKDRMLAGKNRIFFNYLYSHYHVKDVILIDGHKLYSRQGTAFDIRLILIDGRKDKIEGYAPLKNDISATIITDFNDLWLRVFGTPIKTKEKEPKYKEQRIRIIKAKAIAKLKLFDLLKIKNVLLKGLKKESFQIYDETEMVEVSELKKYAEFDRRKNGLIDSDKNIEMLKNNLEVIINPLIIDYYQLSKKALLVEGNHRLAAALELGIKELPVRVTRISSKAPAKAIKVTGYEADKYGYVPANLSPSQIGIKARKIKSADLK